VGAVKRHLEEQTDSVLDSVRLYGFAILSPTLESDRYSDSYQLLERTLAVLESDWLTRPSVESRARLEGAAQALSTWTVAPPPELVWDWREALEGCVTEAIEPVAQWLYAYGLELTWETVGLCASPQRGE